MTRFQLVIGVVVSVVLALLLAGLIVTRRYRAAWAFTLYLAVVFVTDLLQLLWPEIFYKQVFYLAKENAINALRFAVALELMYRTFRQFPSASRTARTLIFGVLAITLVVVWATRDQADTFGVMTRVQPKVLSATVWLFTAVAGLILWYHLPVDVFHKAILIGWVPYLLVFCAGLNYIGSYGREFNEIQNYIQTLAYLAVLVYWARAAWLPLTATVAAKPRAEMALRTLI